MNQLKKDVLNYLTMDETMEIPSRESTSSLASPAQDNVFTTMQRNGFNAATTSHALRCLEADGLVRYDVRLGWIPV